MTTNDKNNQQRTPPTSNMNESIQNDGRRSPSPRRKEVDQHLEENLTPVQRRERIATLLVIAYFALLTGIDYAIILPTAWGYLNSFKELKSPGIAIGLLLAVFSLSGAIAGVIFGHLSDIGFSLRRILLFGTIFKILGNVLYFIGISYHVIIVSRFIAGIGMGLVPPILAELSKRSTPSTRTQLLAKILACRQIGLFLGPCLTLGLKYMNFDIFHIHINVHNAPGFLMACLWLSVLVFTFAFFYDSPVHAHNSQTLEDAWNHYSFVDSCKSILAVCKKPSILVLLLTSFAVYFNQTALETTITPFADMYFGWKEVEVSIVFAIAGVEITIIYVALHFITKVVRDEKILIFALVILSIACILAVIVLPFAKANAHQYMPAFIVFILLDIFSLPLIAVTTTSLFMQQTHRDLQGIGQGVQRFVVNTATIVGPLYAGGLIKLVWPMMSIMMMLVLFSTILSVLVYPSFSSRTTDETTILLSPRNKSDTANN